MDEVLKFHLSQLSPCQTHIQLICLPDLKVVGTLHLIVVGVMLLCEYVLNDYLIYSLGNCGN